MIELNLLPKELRKKRKKRRKVPPEHRKAVRLPSLMIVIGLLLVLFTAHAILIVSLLNKRGLYSTLEEQWDQALTQRKRAERINSRIEEIQRRLGTVKEIVRPALNWTKLLSGLNLSIINNVWLSEMDIRFGNIEGTQGEVPRILLLKGYALGDSEKATSLVAQFMDSLKSNPDFYDHFKEIELESIQSREYENENVMSFSLKCIFRSSDKKENTERG
jgi:hypothetical protein